MDNIKEFLINNYIYILVVILLSIITVIGFLVDKKKSGKGKNKGQMAQAAPAMATPSANTMGQTPVSFQPNQVSPQPVNGPVNVNQMSAMQMPFGNNVSNEGFNPNQNTPVNFGTIPNSSVSPLDMNGNNGTLPQAIPNQGMMSNQMGMTLQEPINQIQSNSLQSNPMQPDNMMAQAMNGANPIPNNNGTVMNNMNTPEPVENMNANTTGVVEPMYQPLSEQKPVFAPREVVIPSTQEAPQNTMNNNMGMPSQNMVNNEVPNVGQTMNTNQSMMNSQMNYNNEMQNNMVNQNNGFGNMGQVNPMPMPNPTVNTVPNPITPPQPVNPQPVNFVYGTPPSNNNSNNVNNQFM